MRLLPARQVGSRLPGSPAITLLLRGSCPPPSLLRLCRLLRVSSLADGRLPLPVIPVSGQGSETTSASPSMAPVSAAPGLLDATFCFICGGQLFTASMTTTSLSKDAPPSLVPRMPLLPPLWQHTVSLREIHTASDQ